MKIVLYWDQVQLYYSLVCIVQKAGTASLLFVLFSYNIVCIVQKAGTAIVLFVL